LTPALSARDLLLMRSYATNRKVFAVTVPLVHKLLGVLLTVVYRLEPLVAAWLAPAVREVDEELGEATLGSSVVAKDRREGGVA